jgi:hypothetical protein
MCPDLVVLVNGMRMAMRAVISTVTLLLLIIYIFAVLFVQLMSGSDAGAGCFETIPQAMNCLLLDGVFVDQSALILKMLSANWFYYVLILFYLSLACLTVLNMLIGVVCEVVSEAARAEGEARLMLTSRQHLMEAMQELDSNNNGRVSLSEFRQLLEKPSVVRLLDDIGIDVFALVECGEHVFHKKTELDFDEFMAEVGQFRGGKTCTVKDAVDIRMFVLTELRKLEERLQSAICARARTVGA